MDESPDRSNEWAVRENKGDWKENLQRKSGRDLSIRFLQSGTVGIWKGYCRECDYTTSPSESFLSTSDKMGLHLNDSGHEILVTGNAGAIGEVLMTEVMKLFETRFADACKQCDAEDEDEYFTFGFCSGCRSD